ncbi:hypothetical protein [Hypericibacter sp.]|uniref:hypothetical protein n=1 Tax=Hypericibacter sp. TaxID=2705401 RepID=UPI003D6CD5E4
MSEPSASPQRIVLIDNGLRDQIGHHTHFALGMARMLATTGHQLLVLAHRTMEPALAAAPLEARPVFEMWLNEFLTEGDAFDRLWNDHEVGRGRFAESLADSGFEPQQGDLLWIPTARAREIAGLAEWLKAQPQRPRIALGFHSLLRPVEPGTVGGLVHRLAGRALEAAVGKDRIFAFATNKPLAVRLTYAMGLPVMTAPLPHFYETPVAADALPYLPAGDGPLVACLGMQREDKRFTEWPAIIEQAHRRRPDLRFLVQVGAGEINSSFAALENNPRIRLVRGYLDDRTFVSLIEASDLLLLPYKPERYVERISGPFVFGAVYGTPSVVPVRSWMAERIAEGRGAGVTYDGDDTTLAEAVAQAADDLPHLKAQAAGIRKDWRTWDGRALIGIALHWCAGRSLEDFKRSSSAP